MKMIAKTLAAAAILVGFAGAATAQQVKDEEAVKLRQGLMVATKLQFGALGGYAQGKNDLPADAAARAETLVMLAKLSAPGYAKGTEAATGSGSKPGSFSSPDFAKAGESYMAELAKLVDATKSGNADAIKAQAGAVGKACKSCHEGSRKD